MQRGALMRTSTGMFNYICRYFQNIFLSITHGKWTIVSITARRDTVRRWKGTGNPKCESNMKSLLKFSEANLWIDWQRATLQVSYQLSKVWPAPYPTGLDSENALLCWQSVAWDLMDLKQPGRKKTKYQQKPSKRKQKKLSRIPR